MNCIVGPLYSIHLKILMSNSSDLENLTFLDLDQFSELSCDKFDCVMLIAMDYNVFIKSFLSQMQDEKIFDCFIKIKKRKLILCDSIKVFWTQFVKDYGNLFTEIYSLDMPFKNHDITHEYKNYRPIYGLPLSDNFINRKISTNDLIPISFAGTVDIYPERLEFLENLEKAGIKVTYLASLYLRNRYEIIPFADYMDFQFKSVFAINFPTIPIRQGAFHHIKGRYWECLATGTKILEQSNPLIKNIPIDFNITNFSTIDDIQRLLDHNWDMQFYLKDKLDRINKYRQYFIPKKYFEQFDIPIYQKND